MLSRQPPRDSISRPRRPKLNTTALVYTAIAASANLLGAAAVVAHSRWTVRALENMVALSAGFMISVALLDLAPEAIATQGEKAALVILFGYLLVHLTQHTLAPHFHFGEEHHHVTKMVSFSALAGLMLHTFVDGVAIASGFGVSPALGLLVFFAILLHKLPEGLAISSLFLASGESRRAALGASAALAISTMIGAILTEAIPGLGRYGVPLAAGVTLYVGASNLVPEFQGKGEWRLAVSFFAGCAIYYVARRLVGA
jgi:ZIP family zinc transporter/zinc and cadmium transporter